MLVSEPRPQPRPIAELLVQVLDRDGIRCLDDHADVALERLELLPRRQLRIRREHAAGVVQERDHRKAHRFCVTQNRCALPTQAFDRERGQLVFRQRRDRDDHAADVGQRREQLSVERQIYTDMPGGTGVVQMLDPLDATMKATLRSGPEPGDRFASLKWVEMLGGERLGGCGHRRHRRAVIPPSPETIARWRRSAG